MERETVSTGRAPAAIGPYSQAVRAGGFVFLAGQLPIDPVSGELQEGNIGVQTDRVLTSIKAILEEAGSGLELVVKATVFMADLTRFQEMNEVYARFFPNHPPARSAVEVSRLPKGAELEIEVVALAGSAE